MSKPNLRKNLAFSSAYQLLNIILPFITAPYVARVLGAEGLGVYSYTNSISTYFLLFAALGTGTYGNREIARVRDDRKAYSKTFWEIELLSIITTVIVLIPWTFLALAYTEYRLVLLILSLSIIGNLFEISWFFSGLEQFQYLVYRNAFFKILGVVLIFIFVKSQSDLLLYIFLMTMTTFIATVSIWVKLPQFLIKVDFRSLDIKPHFKQTLIYFIPTIATSIYNVLDKTMIGLITQEMSQNGYYDQANKVISPLKTIAFTALNGVLGSRISYLFAKKEIDKIKELIHLSMEYILFMGVGLLFGLIGVSNRFVPMYLGSGYEPVIYILMMMSPVILIIGISNCLGFQYYTPSGRRKESSKYIIIGATLNLILNILLIPQLGAYGATLSTILAEGVISYLYVKNAKGFVSFGMLFKLSIKKFIAGIGMLAVIYIVSTLQLSNLMILFLQVALGGASYVLLLIALRDQSVSIVIERLLKRK